MIIPSFHDGHVTSIVLGEKAATLGLKKSDGLDFELLLSGVEALQVEDFRQGNIVLELQVIAGRDPKVVGIDEYLERLFPSPHAKAASKYHETHSAFLAARIAKIISGEAALVIVTPSYGCNLVAYCTAAVLRDVRGMA
jgi:hypothetical protein